jgi:TRAP-type uncharacterized transport system substrate-binding protein
MVGHPARNIRESTDKSVSDALVYNLVKSVMDDRERFKKMHPAFSGLSIDSMIRYGLTAPLHPGAEKYYKERGFL